MCLECVQSMFRVGCQDWSSRLVVKIVCQDWLSRLFVKIVVIASSSASSVSVFGIFFIRKAGD